MSGKKTAVRKWNTVHPLFEACELSIFRILYLVTTHRGHAGEIASRLSPEDCDGLVVISGDGLVHEVLNSLCALDHRNLPVTALPGGSANALASVLCDRAGMVCSLYNSAYIAIKGVPTPMDITKVSRVGEAPVYSFLFVAWGFMADVDIGSEKLRWCGSLRFDIYGLWQLCKLRRYSGAIRLQRDDGELTESGGFVYFLSCNLPFIATGMHVAPQARINDGCNDLLYIRSEHTGRWRLMQVLLKQDEAKHLGLRQLHYVKCRKWSLVPESTQGIFSIDGEVCYMQMYPVGPIDAEVLPSYVTVLALG